MITFEDEKYGKVIIYEPIDFSSFPSDPLTTKQLKLAFQIDEEIQSANIVGIRDIEKKIVKVVKNRYGPCEDFETEQFIFNYKEKVYTKYNRFEIMDI